jgi:hypothetical protein
MRWTSILLNVYPLKNEWSTSRKGYVSFATNLDICLRHTRREDLQRHLKTYQKIHAITNELDKEEKDEIAAQMEKEGF